MGDAASLSLASCIAGRGPPAPSAVALALHAERRTWPHVACEGELQGGQESDHLPPPCGKAACAGLLGDGVRVQTACRC